MILVSFLDMAHAGKLSDGFHGIPYGSASVLVAPPGESCALNPEPGVHWLCQDTIGEARVEVAYMEKEELFYGVVIVASGYESCSSLFSVLVAGYGAGTPVASYDKSLLADRRWRDGSVIGSWRYNKYSDRAEFVAFHDSLVSQIKEKEEEKARDAARDL